MIIVIADDFTGAAELGGIGLRYNLSVEVNTHVNLQSKADLLVIATDTRSMQKQEAEQHMEAVTREVAKLNPTFIFKKVRFSSTWVCGRRVTGSYTGAKPFQGFAYPCQPRPGAYNH